MNERRYTFAGWLAVAVGAAGLLVSIVAVAKETIAFMTGEWSAPDFGWYEILINIPGLVSLYLLFLFRRLLNERYLYHGANRVIMALIWINLAGMILLFLGIGFMSEQQFIGMCLLMFLVVMIVGGVLSIKLALRLLEIKDKTNNLITAYAYLNMVAGVAYVTILGAPIALIMEPILMVMLGMIFLREQDQVEFV